MLCTHGGEAGSIGVWMMPGEYASTIPERWSRTGRPSGGKTLLQTHLCEGDAVAVVALS